MLPEIKARPSLRLRGLLLVNRLIQWGSLVFLGEWALYGAFRCPFVVPFVSCQNCPVMTCPGRVATFFWGFWGIWIALAVFFGRAFCGWVCPGGLLSRILSKNPLKWRLDANAVSTFANAKLLFLIFALGAWFVLGQPRANVPIRVGEFWPSILLTFEHSFPLWQVRTALFVVLILLSVLIGMAWCRFACPFGGFLELVRRFSVFKVYKTAQCNNCNRCQRVCVMETRPDEKNCTNCGDCLSSCPSGCIKIGRGA